MTDPYSVLGISRNASDEEIKKAYRNLSRKYHPDANVNNPNKAQAEEKFKQVQSAYEYIMKEKTEGFSGGGSGHGGFDYGSDPFSGTTGNGFNGAGPQYGYEEDPRFRAAGNYIRSGYYKEARTALDSVEVYLRNDVWYFYSAMSHAGMHNAVAAHEHARKACEMNPGNIEYRLFLQKLENGAEWYSQKQDTYGYGREKSGSICTKICVANLIMNLLCGGCGRFC